MKKISVVVMILCFILGASVFSAFAAEEPNVSVTSVQTQVEVGDIIEINITNKALSMQSLSVFLDFNGDLVYLSEMLNASEEDAEGNMFLYTLNSRGKKTKVNMFMGSDYNRIDESNQFSVLFMPGQDTDILEGTIVTLYFEALANGTAEFVLTQECVGVNAYKGTDRISVTIGSTAPSCDHSSTKLVPNEDGTHNKVCNDCGKATEENVPCTGTDDGDCTTAVTCACTNVVTAAKDAHVAGEDDGDCTTAVKCVNCEKNAVAAAKEHSYTTKDSGKQSTPANCTNAAQNYVQCDNCNAVSKDKTVAVGEPNGHGKVDGFRLYSNYNGTHDVICNDCDKATEEDVTCTVDESQTTYGEGRPANCCEAGLQYKYTYCACGYEFGSADITIPATGDHTLVKYEKEAATCTTSGHEAYWMCDKLGFSFTDADGKNKIEDIHAWLSEGGDGYLPVDPTNHTREAKYVDNGDNTHSATYDCCGAPFVTNEPHDYTSGKEDNTCICGAVKAPEHDICVHDHYDVTETTHQSICSCGKAIGDAEPHDYTTGTVENTCVCGAVKEIPACQHEQTIAVPNDNMTHNIICANEDCGETLRENLPCHDDDGDELCDECGNYIHECVPAHYSNNGDGTHDVICRCQKILVDDEPHIYGEKHACQCGEIEPIGWVEIEGAWYYVYEDYTKATGLSRVPYPTVEIMGNTYAPNAADIAYAESKDRDFIDATEAWFLFEDDGKFAYDSMGYVDHGDSQGKLINGMLPWHIGLVEVAAGEYRYFAGDLVNGGNVIATGKIYVSRNTTDLDVVIGGIYLFDENGKMILNDGIVDIEGTLYYYEDGRLAIDAGLVKVGDAYYYVRSGGEKAGQIVVGRKYWVSDTNGYFAAGMYTFDKDGKMIIGAASGGREGIVEIDGVLYYYVGGVNQIGAGVVEMTDELGETFYIYVKSDGTLATGEYWPTTTNGLLERGCYDWGTDGRYYPAN